jgi:hypothetical protein
MDEDMQRRLVISRILAFIDLCALPWLSVAQPQRSGPAGKQYCNEKYKYCVNVPDAANVEAHEGDSPNHGITIRLSDSGEETWTYAHWDAALLGSAQKVLVRRLEIILADDPTAEMAVASTTIAGLPAYRIRLSHSNGSQVEEILIAYRKPQSPSQDPGIIYEIGLKCVQDHYLSEAKVFEILAATFRQT